MTFQLTNLAQETMDRILKSWENPEALGEALAYTFLPSTRYCTRWSIRNQAIVAMFGHSDACTYRGWLKRGRRVKRDEKAFAILKPVIRRFPIEKDEDGEVVVWGQKLVGFEHWPVFGISQTKVVDEELAASFEPKTEEAQEWLSGLPWLKAAEKWGVTVTTEPYEGQGGVAWYSPMGKEITVTALDLRLWAHELMHASDDDKGTLTTGQGQNPDNEIVADLGAAILMIITGNGEHVDLAGTHKYVHQYLDGQEDAAMAAYRLIGRILDCIENIILASEEVVAAE